jgi:hypothetical protein
VTGAMNRRICASLIALGACSSDAGGDGDLQQVRDLLDDYFAAHDRQCATVTACYPDAQRDEDACRGPTASGGYGWGRLSAQDRAQRRTCLEKIHAREPEATLAYVECLRTVPEAREECLHACPADVTPCVDDVEPTEDACERKAGLALTELASELCR